MRSTGINGEGELRGQPANPGSPGKMAIKTECVCVCKYPADRGEPTGLEWNELCLGILFSPPVHQKKAALSLEELLFNGPILQLLLQVSLDSP